MAVSPTSLEFNVESHSRPILTVRSGWEAAALAEDVGAASAEQPVGVVEGWGGIC